MSRALWFVLLVPRNACVLVLRAYRALISPLYGDVCRYYPSCSSYTMQAIQRFGVIWGAWLGMLRIGRCHPWADGGIDDVPEPKSRNFAITRFGFVVRQTPSTDAVAVRPGPRVDDPLVHSHGKG